MPDKFLRRIVLFVADLVNALSHFLMILDHLLRVAFELIEFERYIHVSAGDITEGFQLGYSIDPCRAFRIGAFVLSLFYYQS